MRCTEAAEASGMTAGLVNGFAEAVWAAKPAAASARAKATFFTMLPSSGDALRMLLKE